MIVEDTSADTSGSKSLWIDPCSKSFHFLSDLVNFGWKGGGVLEHHYFGARAQLE